MNFEPAKFRPALLDALSNYDRARLLRDLFAGATVGVIALPLAMAFAIASGLPPQAGIFTAIIGGFVVSALGGSRVCIGGPAGAFIVVVYAIVERYGVANLLICTMMAGVMLFAMGLFRLGALVRFVPLPVVIGFTNGIAVLIALSQIKDFLGLKIENLPADFFGKLAAITRNLHSINPYAIGLASGSLALIVAWQLLMPAMGPKIQFRRKLTLIPGTIIALVAATIAVTMLDLPVETIGSRFGGVPQALPAFAFPDFTWNIVKTLFAPTVTIALLGAIESLLCARVADAQMNARGADKHNPNQELMAQGVANLVAPLFGGMPVTGTIARTVTNIKSGGSSPVAGMVHAVVLLLIILLAAPLANNVPLAVLAAILVFVAWNMGEWRAFAHLRNFKLPYRATLLGTFFLTVIFDLTMAVEVGLAVAFITFIYRISSLTRVVRIPSAALPQFAAKAGNVAVYRLYGALFFGTVNRIEALAEPLPQEALVLDFKNVLYIDSSGTDALRSLQNNCELAHVRLIVCGLSEQPLEILTRSGALALIGKDNLQPDLQSGLAQIATQTPG